MLFSVLSPFYQRKPTHTTPSTDEAALTTQKHTFIVKLGAPAALQRLPVTVAYLIHAHHWPLSRAYAFVVALRRGVSPNIATHGIEGS